MSLSGQGGDAQAIREDRRLFLVERIVHNEEKDTVDSMAC